MPRYADPGAVQWVESGGGPLIAIPETVLPFWAGADGDDMSCDYDRACDVEGFIGLLPVGDTRALVLGDEPASTTYLPEHGTFVRWRAARSEDELLAAVPTALERAEWDPEEEAEWTVPGPVVLFEAVWSGTSSESRDRLRVVLEPGRYGVRAAFVEPRPGTRVGLVQLRRLTP
ncbi:immunity 21 family protein [Streptomyces sp. NPDC127066]|uniref:immunity 21 family protein n=1 Tax=Streptomyces sp. NPDC127066 TaxID=3347125 RepID=UPI003656AEC5